MNERQLYSILNDAMWLIDYYDKREQFDKKMLFALVVRDWACHCIINLPRKNMNKIVLKLYEQGDKNE